MGANRIGTVHGSERPTLREAARALLEMVDLMIANAPLSVPSGHVLEPYADRLRLALTEEASLPSREAIALAKRLREVVKRETRHLPLKASRVTIHVLEDAADALEALALLPVQGEAWRPISEALRDGGSYLCAEPGSVYIANWTTGRRYTGWTAGSDDSSPEVDYERPVSPTHFRPLPPPPNPEVAALEREEE